MRYLKIAVLLAAGLLTAHAAWGQGYPSKPVRIIVPFAAGSATDIVARLIAEELKTAFGQAFIVDDKPGGSAIIGAEAAAKSPPDGYTLFVTTNTSHSANPFLFKKLPYDPIKDFVPVAGIMIIPVIVVVDPKLPLNSMQELIAYAKANPGKVTFGYGNSIGQVVGASFAKQVGITVTPVPYKSSPQAMTDVMGGSVSYGVTDMAAGQSLVKAGKLRALGVSSEKRSGLMPDLPAMSETPGLAGFDVTAWVAMFAPAGTPKDIVDKLSAEVQKALAKPEIKEKITQYAAETLPLNSAQLSDFVKGQLTNWGKRIKDAGIEPE
ncbi:MAG: tripartite tricarboxylate transporter substrate binding protein [Casimicrobiaceae bacterium]